MTDRIAVYEAGPQSNGATRPCRKERYSCDNRFLAYAFLTYAEEDQNRLQMAEGR